MSKYKHFLSYYFYLNDSLPNKVYNNDKTLTPDDEFIN